MRRLLNHLARVTSAWRRVLTLLWQTQPWFVGALLVLTVVSGLVPSAQIQLTSSIIGSAAQAVRASHPQTLVNTALLFGAAQGGLLLLSALLEIGIQQVQTLLMLRLSNTISIQIMEKAASLDVQYYEDDESYDRLQRANNESGYRPYQIFSQMSMLGSQAVTLVSVMAVLISWNWWLGLLILLAPCHRSAQSSFMVTGSMRSSATARHSIAVPHIFSFWSLALTRSRRSGCSAWAAILLSGISGCTTISTRSTAAWPASNR